MNLGRVTSGLLFVTVAVCVVPRAKAEEITLKSGQKIVGTIVGYENDMFRIQTDYGTALVRKDKVASIQVSKPQDSKPYPEPLKSQVAKNAGARTEPQPPVVSPPAARAPARPVANPQSPSGNTDSAAGVTHAPPLHQPPAEVAAATASVTVKQPEKSTAKVVAPPVPGPPATPAASNSTTSRASPATEISSHVAMSPAPPDPQSAPASPTAAAKPAPPPVSHPLDVPVPTHLQDHIEGNTYFNDTFQFSMYKPPDWKIVEGVPKETGSGIMAMGTDDELTLMIVDRQVWSGAPKLTSDQVEARLRQTYQEYRRLSEETILCDGQPAIRRSFTGILDGAEWHGVAVHVIHGNTVFGIIGLTSAEGYEFQESIFNKILRTFHFLTPAEAASAGPATRLVP